ncbi:long-chain fatty acid--CoA ligase [Arthrobacter sp. PAMC25564]|uniref:AMP-binding protein n=1 Tax=Arthrobacter sp. PAMC25564 TaxID=2565366 RepID=UPI0010A24A67|nr:AMP-binding protein [Arthrobacter sp. PAMC25564]QCB97975.1 long-chain fatty acid--CoA ligase [Arthrobacter sp. PAMC25564]
MTGRNDIDSQARPAGPNLPDLPTRIEPRFSNASDLFEHAYRQAPDSPGVYYFDTMLTFGELGRRAHAFAAALRSRYGIQPGDRLAIMLQNVPAVPVVMHGAFLAGAIVVPVSAMLKGAELASHLADTGARLVICLESLHATVAEVLPGTAVEHLVVTSELEDLAVIPQSLRGSSRVECAGAVQLADLVAAHRGTDTVPHRAAGSDPALLAYTSGTTGFAKAAVVDHSSFVYAAESLGSWAGIDERDTTVAVAPMFHITGLTGHLATSRSAKSPLLLMYRFEPGEMLRLIERWRGSWMLGPATAFISLMRHPDFASRDLASLTKLHSGGAPLPHAVLENFERATGQYLHNVYGLTETATPSHGIPYGSRSPVDAESGAVSIGVPLPGVHARILSLDWQGDAPVGEVGELALASPTLAAGYWNRPEETAHAFQDGWFHTGDLAKRDAEGYYYIVDRIKDMIIVSGFKVSPRDVEEVLGDHPGILEAAVVGMLDDYRGEAVRAFVVPRAGHVLDAAEIGAFCRTRLASYKVPTRVEFVTEIPRNPAGKIIKRILRDQPVSPIEARSTT